MIEKEIADFIAQNQVATICCSVDNMPYCFNVFYSSFDKEGYIVFKSSSQTRHSDMLTENNKVAGTILPVNLDTSAIQGIQFEGIAMEEDEDALSPASSVYYAKYPIAMAMPGKIWLVHMSSVKLTDNTKGFGYKREWHSFQDALSL